VAAVRPRKPTNDAEAICEAVVRPTMRFVPVKSAERQAAHLDHKTRDFLVRQRTQTVNAIRVHLSEFGPCGPWLGRNSPPEAFVRASPHLSSSVVAKGIHNLDRRLEAARDVPMAARPALECWPASCGTWRSESRKQRRGSRLRRKRTRWPGGWPRSPAWVRSRPRPSRPLRRTWPPSARPATCSSGKPSPGRFPDPPHPGSG
jgi:hypothetical protein